MELLAAERSVMGDRKVLRTKERMGVVESGVDDQLRVCVRKKLKLLAALSVVVGRQSELLDNWRVARVGSSNCRGVFSLELWRARRL